MAEPLLRAIGVTRIFGSGRRTVTACDHIDLEVRAGELLVVRGRSGSGKTTLLNMLGTLDRPTAGAVLLDGLDVATAPEKRLVEVRRATLGFVFQSFGLVPVLSAAENVEIPLRLQRISAGEREERVHAALDAVGLARHATQRPGELSGGQQQRVGIARALVARPRVLLADEPTGQLDSATGLAMVDLLAGLVHDHDVAAVVATHDPTLIDRGDRVIELRDGRVRA